MFVGFAASVTAAALIPSLHKLRHFPDPAGHNALLGASPPAITGGMAPVSNASGLGIEISGAEVARFLVGEIA
jgi:L-alanine-DL-glutamate epimerase-like enolase superfamily enzyme